ncbi:MAG: DUF2939 domain-containing protein [Brevundimonas sp.]|uniref:DUF2939 domain-containing protein n=1 Tax=Brevundimonas sp. TaxID=1871086 RepID=UPI0011F74751|nr:DUF2939 domain-containing protein [Brevundimonas sp.]RZJ16833.1 MAG: DUF2939 domain-containing protein [Brevundimonas sp.]
MSKTVKAIITAGALAVAALWAAAPVFAAQSLVRAARAGDQTDLRRLVDFPAFRQSLKDELNAHLVAQMREKTGDSALSGLGMLLAPTVVSGAVDALITPQAISAMVRTGEAPTPSTVLKDEPSGADRSEVKLGYGYRDLNTFAVTLTRADRPGEPVVLLMERRGVVDWKLAGIDLPEA